MSKLTFMSARFPSSPEEAKSASRMGDTMPTLSSIQRPGTPSSSPETTPAALSILHPVLEHPMPTDTAMQIKTGAPSDTGTTYKIRLVPHLDSPRLFEFNAIERGVKEGDPSLRVGRFTDAMASDKLAFKSKVVSRAHAEIWVERGGRFFVRDTKSSSGTYLNHVRLSPANTESRPFQIKDGDILQLGVTYQGSVEDIYRAVKIKFELLGMEEPQIITPPEQNRLAEPQYDSSPSPVAEPESPMHLTSALTENGPSPLPSSTIAEPANPDEPLSNPSNTQSSPIAAETSDSPSQEVVSTKEAEAVDPGQPFSPDAQAEAETDQTSSADSNSTKTQFNTESENPSAIGQGAKFNLLPISWAVQSESQVAEEEVVNFDCARGHVSHYTSYKSPSTGKQKLTSNAHSAASGSSGSTAAEFESTSSQGQHQFAGKQFKFKPLPWWIRICYSGNVVELVDEQELKNGGSTTGRTPESQEIVGYSMN